MDLSISVWMEGYIFSGDNMQTQTYMYTKAMQEIVTRILHVLP
jgi:hypothetical protein